jgi:hypothetical protein
MGLASLLPPAKRLRILYKGAEQCPVRVTRPEGPGLEARLPSCAAQVRPVFVFVISAGAYFGVEPARCHASYRPRSCGPPAFLTPHGHCTIACDAM